MNWLGRISDTIGQAEGFITNLDSSAARVAARAGLVDGAARPDDGERPEDAGRTGGAQPIRTPATGHAQAQTPVHSFGPHLFAEPAPRPRAAPSAPATPQTAQAAARPHVAHSADDGNWDLTVGGGWGGSEAAPPSSPISSTTGQSAGALAVSSARIKRCPPAFARLPRPRPSTAHP